MVNFKGRSAKSLVNFESNTKQLFFSKKFVGYVGCKMRVISFRPQWVNTPNTPELMHLMLEITYLGLEFMLVR